MKQLVIVALFLALAATQAEAQINAGEQKPEPSLPFNMVQVATLNLPWRIAFPPDGRMLISEKVVLSPKLHASPKLPVPEFRPPRRGGVFRSFK